MATAIVVWRWCSGCEGRRRRWTLRSDGRVNSVCRKCEQRNGRRNRHNLDPVRAAYATAKAQRALARKRAAHWERVQAEGRARWEAACKRRREAAEATRRARAQQLRAMGWNVAA